MRAVRYSEKKCPLSWAVLDGFLYLLVTYPGEGRSYKSQLAGDSPAPPFLAHLCHDNAMSYNTFK